MRRAISTIRRIQTLIFRTEALPSITSTSTTKGEQASRFFRISTFRSNPVRPSVSSAEPEVRSTSLVNLISRLYDVTEGSIKVGGKDVRSYDMETLRNEVAVVLQKNVLFSGTILDNLRWGDKNASEEECKRVCRLACADEFIDRMPEGYNTYIEQGGSNVSGGQKQRLCIARALLKNQRC